MCKVLPLVLSAASPSDVRKVFDLPASWMFLIGLRPLFTHRA
jgi:hypothetical protein